MTEKATKMFGIKTHMCETPKHVLANWLVADVICFEKYTFLVEELDLTLFVCRYDMTSCSVYLNVLHLHFIHSCILPNNDPFT